MNSTVFSKNYTALRNVAFMAILLGAVSNGIWAYIYVEMKEASHQVVYIATDQDTYPAKLISHEERTIFEARNHVKQFAHLMFAHDESTYEAHIQRALYMIDKPEGLAIYEDFEKNQVKDNYIKHGSRSFLEELEVEISMDAEPYIGTVRANQIVQYHQKQITLPITATFSLVRTRRSEENPFGLLLQDWKFVSKSAVTSKGGVG